MRITAAQLTTAIVRQTIFGVLVLALALPLVNALHARFGLGSPPASALILMGGSVLACFIGAGIIGAICGSGVKAGRGPGALLASVLSLGWSLLVCSIVIPFYGSMIVDHITQDAAMTALRERGALFDRAKDAYGGVREGRGGEVARSTAGEAVSRSVEMAKKGAARLPAMSLLFWTLIGPPLGAAFEAARARRR